MVMKFIDWIIAFFSKKRNKSEVETSFQMENVVNSMFLSKSVYDELKTKCHPDRYVDDQQKELAQQLFQKLQKSRYNHKQLLELKEQIFHLWKHRKL